MVSRITAQRPMDLGVAGYAQDKSFSKLQTVDLEADFECPFTPSSLPSNHIKQPFATKYLTLSEQPHKIKFWGVIKRASGKGEGHMPKQQILHRTERDGERSPHQVAKAETRL